jgi:hypothetical protein
MKKAESCEFTGFSIHQNQKVNALGELKRYETEFRTNF